MSRSCVSQDRSWSSSGGGEGTGFWWRVHGSDVSGDDDAQLNPEAPGSAFQCALRSLKLTPLLESLDSRSWNELGRFLLIGYWPSLTPIFRFHRLSTQITTNHLLSIGHQPNLWPRKAFPAFSSPCSSSGESILYNILSARSIPSQPQRFE